MTTDLRQPHYSDLRPTLTGKRQEVHALLAKHGPATCKELAAKTGWDKCSIRPRICNLMAEGFAEATGIRRNSEHEFRALPVQQELFR